MSVGVKPLLRTAEKSQLERCHRNPSAPDILQPQLARTSRRLWAHPVTEQRAKINSEVSVSE